jgi:hypothetical protein
MSLLVMIGTALDIAQKAAKKQIEGKGISLAGIYQIST